MEMLEAETAQADELAAFQASGGYVSVTSFVEKFSMIHGDNRSFTFCNHVDDFLNKHNYEDKYYSS